MSLRNLICFAVAAACLAGCATETTYAGIVQSYDTRPEDFASPEGRALIGCVVGLAHVLRDCAVISATPDTAEVRNLALRGAVDYDVVGAGYGDLPEGAPVRFWVTVQIH